MNKVIIIITAVILALLAPMAGSLARANSGNLVVDGVEYAPSSSNQGTVHWYVNTPNPQSASYNGISWTGNGSEHIGECEENGLEFESMHWVYTINSEKLVISHVECSEPEETTVPTIPETTVETTVPETTTTVVVETTIPEVTTTVVTKTTDPVITTTTVPVTSTEVTVVESTTTIVNSVVDPSTTTDPPSSTNAPVQPFVAPDELPATGGETGVIAIFAGLLLILGVGLVLIRKYVNS